MNTTQINAVLRGATAEKLIRSWSQPVIGFWYITPLVGKTREVKNWKEAHDFAEMLLEAGVEPRELHWPE